MSKLALLGGSAIRTRPFMGWPEVDMDKMETALLRVLHSKKWGSLHGSETRQFETEFAAYQDARFGIACSNGTIALQIALNALEIGPGDEVILPAYSFIASAVAVLGCRAIPVFADMDPETYTIDIESVESLISERTRAIMPVHIGGRPADMDALENLAQKHGLVIVEDAAQAWGSVYKNRKVGAIGQCGTFSFQSSKNITSGEGGIILTNDENLAGRIASWVNCGRKKDGLWYAHYLPAGNQRLTEFQSAVLRAQLEDYDHQKTIRQKNARFLDQKLQSLPCFRPISANDDYQSSIHIYIVRYFQEEAGGIPKSRMIDALKAEGLMTHGGYSLPLYEQPVFSESHFFPKNCPFECKHSNVVRDYSSIRLPHSEKACRDEAIWIPQSLFLGSESDMMDIVAIFEKVFENHKDLFDG